MTRPSGKTSLFFISGMIALILGGAIYVLFRPYTYISDIFAGVPLPRRFFGFLNVGWIKYYFADFLWAYSLCCGLQVIFRPKVLGSLLIAGVTALYGGLLELLQYTGHLSGTGDLWDVLMFILAGISVNMINLIANKEKTP